MQSYKIDDEVINKILIVTLGTIVLGGLSRGATMHFQKKDEQKWLLERVCQEESDPAWRTLVQHTHLSYIQRIVIQFILTEDIWGSLHRKKPSERERYEGHVLAQETDNQFL